MNLVSRCPCGSGESYAECCRRYHSGAAEAPTARTLMASRFAAFAVGDAEYLLATWHPDRRPAELSLDDRMRWIRLEVIDTVDGGPFDAAGVVEFRAHYRVGSRRGVLHERSTFLRERGHWYYLAGEVSAA